MKITQEEAVDGQVVLQIELEDEDLDPYLDRGYRRVVQRTVIAGFRKGKAPRRIVENYLGRESLLNEVLDSMLPEVASRAVVEQKLNAADLPNMELLNLAPFTLKATVPLTPEVDLGPYGDIRIAEEPLEVTEEDVQQHLDQLRHNMASWEPVERPVEMGDMVSMKAAGKVEDRTVLDEKDAVFFLDEDGTRPFPGFSQHLVGLAKDEPKSFTLTVPEDYSDRAIAGKEAHFSVTMSEIKERILPELDDELAKGVGDGYDSLDVLRREVEKELKAEAENRTVQQHKDSVVKALLETASIELPPLMVEREIDHLEEDRARMLDRVNVRMDDYLKSIGKTEEEMRGELREQAVDRLKGTLALSKVSELEGLEIQDEEVDGRVESLLSDTAQRSDGRQVTDELKGSVRRMLLAEKTVDRLVAIAKGEVQAESRSEPAEDAHDIEENSSEEGGDADDTQA